MTGAEITAPRKTPPEPVIAIRKAVGSAYASGADGIYSGTGHGYWSNLHPEENRALLADIATMGTRHAVRKHQSWLYDVIFSPQRGVGLELLGLTGTETCLDCGCMWGALTIPLAKRTAYVLAVDQTLDSLRFLKARTEEERCSNVDLLLEDLNRLRLPEASFDVAVVNGVLEWVADTVHIDLKDYWGRRMAEKDRHVTDRSPRDVQKAFIGRIRDQLSPGGRLYLAIENRFDYKMFIGFPDPHAGVPLLSILPRQAAEALSWSVLKRPYRNWLYSFRGLERLVREAGFSRVNLFGCYPDYRFPSRIFPYAEGIGPFETALHRRKATTRLRRALEGLLFGRLQLRFFIPSIIAIAEK